MKEIIYPQRLRETIVGKGNLSYIRTAHLNLPPPPITCTPSTRSFLNNPVNYNLVSKADYSYGFYTIVESDGQRHFVRVDSRYVPTESVIGNLQYDSIENDDDTSEADMTAAVVATMFVYDTDGSTSGFNEDFSYNVAYSPHRRFIDNIWFRFAYKPTRTPWYSSFAISKLEGLSMTSSIPSDFALDIDMLDLRLYPDPYSFKLTHATADEREKYAIVDTSQQVCINIIDYINGGNELEAFSCAKVDLPTDPNHDDVSLISCVCAPTEYTFGIQNMYDLSDLSGTLQITDTVTGFTKKYIFKEIYGFLSNWVVDYVIPMDFPIFYFDAPLGRKGEWIIMSRVTGVAPENYFNPLKIIIQMNSPNALFTNNGTNRLAFCLDVRTVDVNMPS